MSLRDTVFPIYGKDVTRFLVLCVMKFCIIFVLTLTRDLKDTLIVTSCGAEAISFLKVYGVLPCSTLFLVAYSYLSNMLSRRYLWITITVPFFIFFVAFGFIIYPLRESLQPSTPTVTGVGQIDNLLRHWIFAIFYVVAEVFSTVSVGILFWQFANDVVEVEKSSTFYPLFGQISSLAPIAVGYFINNFAATSGTSMEVSIKRSSTAVCICGAVLLFLHSFYMTNLVEDSNMQIQLKKKSKSKLSFFESVKFLLRSEYLGCVAILVLSYGLLIQFTDIMWKSMVMKLYPEDIDYQRYFATFSSRVGMATFTITFLGSHIVKRFGWKFGALLTPTVMAVLATPFFALIVLYARDDSSQKISSEHLALIVWFGALQSMFSRASKNAFFDPTTQMVYIPLDSESKSKGKAAIDVMGSRIGKSGCALLQQGLVLSFGSINAASPLVVVIFYTVMTFWMGAGVRLSTLFERLKKENRENLKAD